ncbi:MAG: hypothetical protein ACLTZT_20875 [Butyricimonas faecalis]
MQDMAFLNNLRTVYIGTCWGALDQGRIICVALGQKIAFHQRIKEALRRWI